jgi:hypothetical protein
MKRLVSIVSVMTALALSSVAAAPASAGSISYFSATIECTNTSAGAKYTLTVKTSTQTYSQAFTIQKTTCAF